MREILLIDEIDTKGEAFASLPHTCPYEFTNKSRESNIEEESFMCA